MTNDEIAWIAAVAMVFGVLIRWSGFRGGSQFVVLPRWLYERGMQA